LFDAWVEGAAAVGLVVMLSAVPPVLAEEKVEESGSDAGSSVDASRLSNLAPEAFVAEAASAEFTPSLTPGTARSPFVARLQAMLALTRAPASSMPLGRQCPQGRGSLRGNGGTLELDGAVWGALVDRHRILRWFPAR
jgi:hypothetical protein